MRVENRTYCGACNAELPLNHDVFICNGCFLKLTDDTRAGVFQGAGAEARPARIAALRELGVEIEEKRLAIPHVRPIGMGCSHDSYTFRQSSIFGGEDEVCDSCGHVRRKRA